MKRKVLGGSTTPATDKPIEVTDATLKEITQGHAVVVVDCWAPWCGPCRMIAPIIEELARDYTGRIIFGKLNTDENPNAATQHGIMSIPTLLIFKNGQLVDRIVGAMPRQMLEPKITRHLE
ncbi:MAG: thioredoxin [Candidatus Bathyarchaeota archaeon]|nr:MAG: thioredoxin [Candidatus Bathyarchaeota archaeon]